MKTIKRYFVDYVKARKCLARGCGRRLRTLEDGRYLVYWEV